MTSLLKRSDAVKNMINEWRRDLTFAIADDWAIGFEIVAISSIIGRNDDSFESFILDVYNRCKDIGLSRKSISSHMQDLVGLSTNVLPLQDTRL